MTVEAAILTALSGSLVLGTFAYLYLWRRR